MARGRTPPAALMAAWTSCAAASMSRSRLNCSVMVVLPKELAEVIIARPLIWPNCRSRGVVTEEVITSGLAPGYWAVTWMVGKSTDGNAEIGKSAYPDRKSTRLNSSHGYISYAVFCLKKKKKGRKHISVHVT